MKSSFSLSCNTFLHWDVLFHVNGSQVNRVFLLMFAPIQATQEIVCIDNFTKVLGMEWDLISNTFQPMIPSYPTAGEFTKRTLILDIAHLCDALGWSSPAIVKPRILLQGL